MSSKAPNSAPESQDTKDAESVGTVPQVGIDNKGKKIEELKFYPDSPTHFSHKARFTIKGPSQFYDPCAEASKMSMKCLERNNYDKDMCIEYFKAYKECKQEWVSIRSF